MSKKRENTIRSALRRLDLPEDAALRAHKCTLLGRSALTIENHEGILSYESDEIRFLTAEGELTIEGSELEILEFDGANIEIRGTVNVIRYGGAF